MSPLLACLALLIRHCLSGCGAENSTLSIEKKCGKAYTIEMTYDSMQRKLSMYIPNIFCDEDEFSKYVNKRLQHKENPFDPKVHQITIPMLVAIHCLGCEPMHEVKKWQSYAEDHTFILIAPQGTGTPFLSWNADQCCDPAVQNDVDDIGFIQTIINGAQTSFSGIFPFATVSNKKYDGYVWITGFSNGGFMADKIAWISTINQFSKIVAAAPMAGYIYDNSKYIKNALKNGDKHNKVAIYFHHSKTDHSVNPNGCCMEVTDGCCCGIAQKSLKCLSIYDEFSNWLQWNGCDKDIKYENIKTDKVIHIESHGDKHVDVSCAYATPQQHGCDTYTNLCMYDNTHHSEWASYVPQSDEVMIFFLKALCVHQHGIFNDVMLTCECAKDSMFGGLYCITPKHALGMTVVATVNNDKTDDKTEDKNIFIEKNTLNDNVKHDASTLIENKKNMQKTNDIVHVDKNEPKTEDTINAPQKWQQVVRNGKDREIKRKNKDLSVLGAANDKYSGKKFEFDSVNDNVLSWTKLPNTSIVLICSLIFASIGLFVMYKKKQNGYRYSKVKLDDHDAENEVMNNTLIANH